MTPHLLPCFLPVTSGEVVCTLFFFLQNFEKEREMLKFKSPIVCQTQVVRKVLVKVNSYPSFLINYFYPRKGNVNPDPLFVLSLRPASRCHSLRRSGKQEKSSYKHPTMLLILKKI